MYYTLTNGPKWVNHQTTNIPKVHMNKISLDTWVQSDIKQRLCLELRKCGYPFFSVLNYRKYNA